MYQIKGPYTIQVLIVSCSSGTAISMPPPKLHGHQYSNRSTTMHDEREYYLLGKLLLSITLYTK